MVWNMWLTGLWRQRRPLASAHRLRRPTTEAGLQVLESRLYLGTLPGLEAAIWAAPADPLPAEPAVIELVSYDAVDDLLIDQFTPQTLAEEVASPPAVTAAEGTGASTIPQLPAVATSSSLMGEMLPTNPLTPALEDPSLTPSVETTNVSSSSLELAPLTLSLATPIDTIAEVPDPGEGGAQSGALPFGQGLEATSTLSTSSTPQTVGYQGPTAASLLTNAENPLVVKYDFRDQGDFANVLTAEQQAVVEQAMADWTTVLHGAVQFERDTTLPDDQILKIGMGSLATFGYQSTSGGALGLGGGSLTVNDDGTSTLNGLVWLDQAEAWDNTIANGNVEGTVDLYTVVSHEIGHALGLEDTGHDSAGAMNGIYAGERTIADLYTTVLVSGLLDQQPWAGEEGYNQAIDSLTMGYPQLQAGEVQAMLAAASMATPSEDGIMAVVDRNGRILGVRVEQQVLDTITDPATLVFAIDGAVAKARTAALFANGDPDNIDSFSPNGTATPLTSRLVRFISQSTMTEREVASNPNIQDPDSTLKGPGFVAPIGIGGHFPPEIANTPPVDLFNIEHTNRDSIINAGDDLIRGTADDYLLRSRFNIDPATLAPGQELFAPESYGFVSGMLPDAQSRGIATLPGGIPLFRDTNGDQIGDTLVGGIGVFFPGTTGDATFEQNFIAGIGQTEEERTNAPKVLEAEFIAVVAAGGSIQAQRAGAIGAKPGASEFDIPFGRLDLVGIQLQVIGPTAGIQGVIDLVAFGNQLTNNQPGTFASSGVDMPIATDGVTLYGEGISVAEGWIVMPQDSTDGTLTAADVEQIVQQSIDAAEKTRSAIRLTAGVTAPGSRSRMVIAVADKNGEILGLYRMKDATVFSIDVAVAKARNTAYYADAAALQPEDQLVGVDPGVAFTNRTFRFVAEPRFPSGVEGSQPPQFSILNAPGIDPTTGENIGAPLPASAYDGTVVGYDAFNPMTNFRDPGDAIVEAAVPGVSRPKANQNGIVFFPGSTPLYGSDGTLLVGGFGISGDGVDQDDVVTFLGAQGYLPDGGTVQRADQVAVNGVRLPYQKFLRNPFG